MRFSDLVGQDHVAKTLGNAIDGGRVAHAFLFTGVRGVGKTTSARILAKALNCRGNPETRGANDPDPGPTVEPCLLCEACQEIAEGRDVDVQEIDGASYNGVDEVRKLQDSLPYRPNRDRYKIVIVDEVHMLTQAAWNAFLKTLEEPPAHVKFIFATTEVHKVPITILSRVQRFDFKMIPTRLIMDRLRWVLAQEEISADEEAIGILARQAAGSMRDAMSLLDQVIAYSGTTLSGSDVAQVLGVASRGALLEIADKLISGDGEACLRQVGALFDQGFDIPKLTADLLALLRDLVVSKVCKDGAQLLDGADDEQQRIGQLSQLTSENDLMRLHTAFSRGFDDVVRGADPRAGLEMLLVRLAHRPELLPLDELLQRVGKLERRLSQGQPRPSPTQARGAPAPAPAQRADARSRERGSESSTKKSASSDDDVPAAPPPAAPPPAMAESAMAKPAIVEQIPPPQPAAPSQSAAHDYSPSQQEKQGYQMMEQIAQVLRDERPELAAYFGHLVPLGEPGQKLRLGLEKNHLFEQQLTTEAVLAQLQQAAVKALGPTAQLIIEKNCPQADVRKTLNAELARAAKARHRALVLEVRNHPRVQKACEILDARILGVKLPDDAPAPRPEK